MILNGLGFVSAPLYLFSEFFIGKATEHLLGEGIKPEHLNDDRIVRALDSLWNQGLTPLFTSIALLAHPRFNLLTKSMHLDSSSFSLEGSYEGVVGNNTDVGFYIHPTLMVDSESGFPLGLSTIQLWTRTLNHQDKYERNYQKLPIEEKNPTNGWHQQKEVKDAVSRVKPKWLLI